MSRFWHNWNEDSWADFDKSPLVKETNPKLERVQIGNLVYIKDTENRTLTPVKKPIDKTKSAFELTRDMIFTDDEREAEKIFHTLKFYHPEYLEPEEKETLWSKFVNAGVSLDVAVISFLLSGVIAYILITLTV